MSDDPFRAYGPRRDLTDDFPAELLETLQPVLLAESQATTTTLVALELLRLVARAGGTRAAPAGVQRAIELVQPAISAAARRWCEDEAKRIATWCAEAESEEGVSLRGDRAVMAEADISSRVALVTWAVEAELDVEIEFYDDEADRWPRMRATPLRIEGEDDPEFVLKTSVAEISIPVANVRWLMPVERRDQPKPRLARVLTFPSFREEE